MEQKMDTKLIGINEKLKKLRENMYAIASEKKKLLQTEDELHLLFRKSDRLFQDLNYSWKHGEMSNYVQDVDIELKNHERKMTQALKDEIHSLNQKAKLFKEKESELQHEIRLLSLSMDDDDLKT